MRGVVELSGRGITLPVVRRRAGLPLGRGVMRTRKRLPFRSQASRSWSIRAKIISLLLVPLITLVAMWALATAVTLGPGLDLLDAQNNVETVGRPVQALVAEIQAERKMSMVYLASGRKDPAALTAQRSETDARVTRLRQSAGSEDARNAAHETLHRVAARRRLLCPCQAAPLRRLIEATDVGERPADVDRHPDAHWSTLPLVLLVP